MYLFLTITSAALIVVGLVLASMASSTGATVAGIALAAVNCFLLIYSIRMIRRKRRTPS